MADLPSVLGPNLTRAHRHMQTRLKAHKLGSPFRDDVLTSLLQHHPSKKFKSHSMFVMAKRPPYNKPCLYSVSKNQCLVDVSWVWCLKKLYGHSTDDSKQKVLMAFRNEAFRSAAMQRAREHIGVGRCRGCDRVCKLHVDHADKPFAQIVDEFLVSRSIRLHDVVIRFNHSLNLFKDTKLAAAWHTWHDEHATLEGLCKRCNCAKGSSGYRHMA